MKNFKFKSPSLELGGGDGVFSFIRGGGQFHPNFDVFLNTNNLKNFFDNVDIYDFKSKNIENNIIKKPSNYMIDYSLDHKKSLLEKSKDLKIYKKLIYSNANKKLPFDNQYFSSIFSNIIYWLNEPEFIFEELNRILRINGELCILLPDKNFLNCSIYNNLFKKNGDNRFSFLKYIDRGRFSSNIKHFKSRSEWEKIFYKNNLEIINHKMHLSSEIIKVWDIGFRPFFPFFMKMYKNLKTSAIPEIKEELFKNLEIFIKPLINIEKEDNDLNKTFNCYFLKKKK
jgi:SAM-dependent methyltransferase